MENRVSKLTTKTPLGFFAFAVSASFLTWPGVLGKWVSLVLFWKARVFVFVADVFGFRVWKLELINIVILEK